MDQPWEIRRLANGAIDYDYYRTSAHALRNAAVGRLFTLKVWISALTALTSHMRLWAGWKFRAGSSPLPPRA
ncbi:MAG: hypothetical protein R3D05_13985 [Dongiaceae bacterium]